MLVLEWKERAFTEKVNSRCFCWFPVAILVDQNGTPMTWRLRTKLYKGAWNVSANNSETVGHKDLTFHFLGFFYWTISNLFFVAWQWKRSISVEHKIFQIMKIISLNFTSTKNSKVFNGREIGQLQPRKVAKKITLWNLIWIFFRSRKKLHSSNKSTCSLCFMMDLRCLSKRGSEKDGSLLNTSYHKLLFYYTFTPCLYVVVVENI